MRISAQQDLEVCGEAATEDEALALVKETNPNLMIVDISLKGGNGLDLVKQVKARHPAMKIWSSLVSKSRFTANASCAPAPWAI